MSKANADAKVERTVTMVGAARNGSVNYTAKGKATKVPFTYIHPVPTSDDVDSWREAFNVDTEMDQESFDLFRRSLLARVFHDAKVGACSEVARKDSAHLSSIAYAKTNVLTFGWKKENVVKRSDIAKHFPGLTPEASESAWRNMMVNMMNVPEDELPVVID